MEREQEQHQKIWRFIDSGIGSAAWNMAVDEALFRSHGEGDLPILRLYGWEPALSLGRFSDPWGSLDMDRIAKEEISYVRRITGGGILVHGGDISYALILPRRFVRDRGVKESYRYLCSFLLRFYRYMNLDAAFAQDEGIAENHTAVCLAGREAYDIVVDGRKIGGNAQRYSGKRLLQHGTVPLRIDRERFETLFSEESGLEEAATLEGLGIGLDRERLKEALLQSFRESFDVTLLPEGLRGKERQSAKKLHEEKYSKEAWNVHAQSTLQQT